MADDRPSWLGDTLTGEPLDIDEELAALGAEVDHLGELLRRYKQESDRPPDEPPPASAALAA
mgnify:FL=1